MANRTALEKFGRSGNPMFRSKAFAADATFRDRPNAGVAPINDRMSLAGAINKTGILLLLCLVTAHRRLCHLLNQCLKCHARVHWVFGGDYKDPKPKPRPRHQPSNDLTFATS